MRAVDLIHKKRLGLELAAEELKALVAGYVAGEVADYQMSAFAMAVMLQGMTNAEAAHLTSAMAASGEQLDWSDLPGVIVDKHSTGGVGDTTTLVLAPLVAAAGATVVKMSGRGLGHTGGTIDKLESIPGFRTALTDDEIRAQAGRIGLAVAAQTQALAPADKKLYALRDVTDTVESIPLIASSVMSKKLAAGADAIVLDVKVGAGAFMKDVASARLLACLMVDIGRRAGRRVCALLTRMDEPLGWAIGNALEVREAILTLRGRGPADLTELCLHLGAQMLVMAGLSGSAGEARQRLQEVLETGQALAKFKQFVAAQGGDPRVADDLSLLPQAPVVETLLAPEQGVVTAMQAEAIGRVAMALGAGRDRQEDTVDARVGLVLRRKVGEPVRRGEPLVEVHARTVDEAQKALETLRGLIEIRDTEPFARPLVLEIIGEESVGEGVKNEPVVGQREDMLEAVVSGGPPQDLLQAAARARQRAYVPYSGFAVGAAVRLDDGRVVEGANMENASYGLTQCAERTALFSALMLGVRPEHGSVRELLVLADSPQPVTPCGACRQVMAELCGPETPVWLTNTDGTAKRVRVADLLPLAFTQEQMRK
ncbi:thymidine phosphorylase [Alicyclobacillus shizuokensis]|uniref:thymidine phosphorylase n=1 Tax=Alicyclobacillus shizuokensis TaxID=392014 RepID=UPI00082F100E|nr:thymidine phosphorylase [Alicyclobacillus shizuokensis]MCL6627229.1 thymidine phosphorylase [Alicyclobacillus shizuokensis]